MRKREAFKWMRGENDPWDKGNTSASLPNPTERSLALRGYHHQGYPFALAIQLIGDAVDDEIQQLNSLFESEKIKIAINHAATTISNAPLGDEIKRAICTLAQEIEHQRKKKTAALSFNMSFALMFKTSKPDNTVSFTVGQGQVVLSDINICTGEQKNTFGQTPSLTLTGDSSIVIAITEDGVIGSKITCQTATATATIVINSEQTYDEYERKLNTRAPSTTISIGATASIAGGACLAYMLTHTASTLSLGNVMLTAATLTALSWATLAIGILLLGAAAGIYAQRQYGLFDKLNCFGHNPAGYVPIPSS